MFDILITIFFLWTLFFLVYILFDFLIYSHGVPYIPSSDKRIKKLLNNLPQNNKLHFLDIGCGDGRVVEAVKTRFLWRNCVWIENSLYPYFRAKQVQKKSAYDYNIIKWNFFKKDIGKYNIIYCYLLPVYMKKVWQKVSSECQPGTLLYSTVFEVKNKKPKEKIHIKDEKYFYVYEV